MAQPKFVLKSLTPALTITYSVEALRPGSTSIFTDYSQGVITLRDSVTFSMTQLSKQYHRMETRVPYSVVAVDAVTGATILDSRSYTKIVRDFSTKLTLAQRTAEYERLSSLFNKIDNPDFYQAWINGSPMLST